MLWTASRKGERLIVSSENKIDRIEKSLQNIEHLLKSRSEDASPFQTPSSTDSHCGGRDTRADYLSAEQLEDRSGATTPYAGFTGHQRDSMAAKDILEQTVESNLVVRQDQQFSEALSSLQTIIGKLRSVSIPSQ